MIDKNLDELVKSGDIIDYQYEDIDEKGQISKESNLNVYGHSEQLIIKFLSGKTICIDTTSDNYSGNSLLNISTL
jgi:hypothetical protein